MPIKFRCEFCRQMLGISRSRAGAIVDCPGCGRSLRVPSPDGSVEPLPSGGIGSDDYDLLRTALEQLSAMRVPEELPQRDAGSGDSAEVQVVEILPADSSVAIHFDSREPEPKSSQQLEQSRWRTRTLCCMSLLVGLLCGGIVSPILFRHGAERFAVGPAEVQKPTVIPILPATSQPMEESEVIKPDFGSVTGRVTWKEASGLELPDTAALILLLPVRHPGVMKLDGTSLREIRPNPDQRAVAAALLQFGGTFTRADPDGGFHLSRRSESEMHLVVVSRHRTRRDDDSMMPSVGDALGDYFESPAQFTGRLMAVHQRIEAVPQDAESSDLTLRVLIP